MPLDHLAMCSDFLRRLDMDTNRYQGCLTVKVYIVLPSLDAKEEDEVFLVEG